MVFEYKNLNSMDFLIIYASIISVCGTTGKRKACKNCSCGLAEELATESETKDETTTKTSSCGSVSISFYIKTITVSQFIFN